MARGFDDSCHDCRRGIRKGIGAIRRLTGSLHKECVSKEMEELVVRDYLFYHIRDSAQGLDVLAALEGPGAQRNHLVGSVGLHCP